MRLPACTSLATLDTSRMSCREGVTLFVAVSDRRKIILARAILYMYPVKVLESSKQRWYSTALSILIMGANHVGV